TEMNHNGGIRDDEIAEGYILACCSRPRGRVEIDA
ncbi:2Fe-2S iron-sulfur cluster-binding protein, partial [Brucella intermedia]